MGEVLDWEDVFGDPEDLDDFDKLVGIKPEVIEEVIIPSEESSIPITEEVISIEENTIEEIPEVVFEYPKINITFVNEEDIVKMSNPIEVFYTMNAFEERLKKIHNKMERLWKKQ
jgi:hypothetical protein